MSRYAHSKFTVVNFLIPLLLVLQAATGQAQGQVDIAISHFKQLWGESARYSTPGKNYFNKVEKLIDLGNEEGFQIPLSAAVVYKYDSIYRPPGNALEFTWATPNQHPHPLIPDDKTIHKGFEVLFNTKDECYSLIDAIVAIKDAYAHL